MQQYYNILGLENDCTLNDIKLAFRKKAKQFHPDISNSPDAHTKFIQINEAYILLSKLKSESETTQENKSAKDWYYEERRKARQRAAEYARMRYEEYKNSAFYKAAKVLDPIFKFILYGFSIFIFIAPIIFIIYRKLNNQDVIIENFVYLVAAIVISFFVIRTIYKAI